MIHPPGLRILVPARGGRVVVEPGHASDGAGLVEIQAAVLEEERWFVTEPDEYDGSVERAGNLIQSLLTSPNSVFLAAREHAQGGALLGALLIRGGTFRRLHHVGRLEVFVRKDRRGEGIGHALMETGIRWASQNPLLEKLSLAVFADNARAISLYRKHGFVEEGRRLGEYLLLDGTYLDDILMARWVRGERSRS